MSSSLPTLPPEVLADGHRRTTPSPEEITTLRQIPGQLREPLTDICRSLGLPLVDLVPVGSSNRGTFLPGSRDVDLFARFASRDRKILVRFADEVVPELANRLGCPHERRYAENPYGVLHFRPYGSETEIPVDLVATFHVDDPTELPTVLPLSGMARTPFHAQFLGQAIQGLESEVRLLKYWCKQKQVYGNHGLTGFLTELLVIIYRSFPAVLQHAPEVAVMCHDFHARPCAELRTLFPADPVIIVDPIDPSRNAAGGIHGLVGKFRLARLVHEAKRSLTHPSTTWHQFMVEPPFLLIKVKTSPEVTPINKDDLFDRLARFVGRVERQWSIHEIQLLDLLVDPANFTIMTKVDRLSSLRRPRQGPPMDKRKAVKRFRKKNPEAWFEGERWWTWEDLTGAIELVNQVVTRSELVTSAEVTIVGESGLSSPPP